MKNKYSKKKDIKKRSFKNLILPLFIFFLFLGASIAYYMYFSIPSYSTEYEKIALKYVNNYGTFNILGVKEYTTEDFYKIVYVFIDKNHGIPVFVTLDKKFASHIKTNKESNNDTEALTFALIKLDIPINFTFEYVGNGSNYKIYKVKEEFYKLKDFYFLIGNKSILLFARKLNIEN